MTVTAGVEGTSTVIAVRGEVDMSTAHVLTEMVEHAVGRRPSRVVLDLSEVTFFSAHGISALLSAQSTATGARVELALRDPAPCVAYLLAVTGARSDLTPLGVPAQGGTGVAAPGR
jgi:anti-anti-sigma factor